MTSSLVVGLDLGQSQDFSALSVVDHVRVLPAGVSEARSEQLAARGWGVHSVLERRVVHLQRWQLGTPYDVIVDDVADLMRTEQLRWSWLVYDATGVGRAVKDMLTAAYLDGRMGENWPIGKTITGEGAASRGSVTKRDLMSTLMVDLQQGRFKIAEGLDLRQVLEDELTSFRLKIIAAGRDSYDFVRGQGTGHGDLTIATALAAHVGTGVEPRVESAVAP